ncbi:hypothetical protein AB9E15_02510 [Rhizobium leguminosarum]|uniref:hypothetical protein n=1 Tax=Rhizobium leguminosarum TaxID=384 RepID=UPI003F94879B
MAKQATSVIEMSVELPSSMDIASAIGNGSLLPLVEARGPESAPVVGSVLAELHNDRSFDMIDVFERMGWADLTRQQRFRMSSLLEAFIANATDSVPRMVAFFIPSMRPLDETNLTAS